MEGLAARDTTANKGTELNCVQQRHKGADFWWKNVRGLRIPPQLAITPHRGLPGRSWQGGGGAIPQHPGATSGRNSLQQLGPQGTAHPWGCRGPGRRLVARAGQAGRRTANDVHRPTLNTSETW